MLRVMRGAGPALQAELAPIYFLLNSNTGASAVAMGTQAVDYKTHILIGQTSAGKMTVIWQWPHVPRQAEGEQKIEEALETYVTYLLCAPRWIMPGEQKGARQPPGLLPRGLRRSG